MTAERWAEIEERWPAEFTPGAFAVDRERDEENVRLLIAEVKRLQALTAQWRPISEAPKDGTIILIWLPDRKLIDIARGYETGPMPYTTNYTAGLATHFMPLPEPPEVSG